MGKSASFRKKAQEKIVLSSLNGSIGDRPMISGVTLHGLLSPKIPCQDWINWHIEQYRLWKGTDYFVVKTREPRPGEEIFFPSSVAQALCLIHPHIKGIAVRQAISLAEREHYRKMPKAKNSDGIASKGISAKVERRSWELAAKQLSEKYLAGMELNPAEMPDKLKETQVGIINKMNALIKTACEYTGTPAIEPIRARRIAVSLVTKKWRTDTLDDYVETSNGK